MSDHNQDMLDDSAAPATRLDFVLWRRLLGYTLPYRRDLAVLALSAVCTAAADAGFPLVTRAIIDELSLRGAAAHWQPMAAAYVVLTLVLVVSVRGFIRAGGRIRTHVSHDIRQAGFANLQRLSLSFYDQRPVGWLMSRMTSDCERLSNILAWGALDFIWGITLMSGIAAVMLTLEPVLAASVLAIVPLLIWVSLFFQKRILLSSRRVRAANSRLTAAYNEAVMGVTTTKLLTREDKNLAEFSQQSGAMFDSSVSFALQSALFLPLVLTLASLGTGLVLTMGGFRVESGLITLGTLVAFMSYTLHFFEPVQQMAHWFAEMQMAQASAERVLGLIDAEPEVRDSPAVLAAIDAHRDADELHTVDASRTPESYAEDGLSNTIGSIEFCGVGFAYQNGLPVLSEINLTVQPGQTIALVGATGGGKSTLVNLLARFYEPTAGAILIDGIDLRERSLHWLHSNMGTVLQTPHLFNGTIGDNIRYGRLDATDQEIRAAAQSACALPFIEALPQGMETEVGEGGNRLSTGQKQLLSIARAILADPQVLIMDEATSSIDTETEEQMRRALRHVQAGRMSFVIAHRLSTIRTADRILYLENGRIVEQGHHDELMALNGRYHDLTTRQALATADFQAPSPPAHSAQ